MDHTPEPHDRDVDVLVVGAGFAGLYMLHRARSAGFRTLVVEAGGGVGGTWYWNRYPGARCDVESVEYSYQFDESLQQEWTWSERYAAQPEILAYLEHVADRFDLRRDILFDTRVTAVRLDEDAGRWEVTTDDGTVRRARFVVMATGPLSVPTVPDLPGLDTFAGPVLHTGRWPHEPVDLVGRRVGVIGTGSSGVQSIPVIAAEAARVTVFQRTPAYTVPARNRPLTDAEVAEVKADYPAFRAANAQMPLGFGSRRPVNEGSALAMDEVERTRVYEERWEGGGLGFLGAFVDLLIDPSANATAAAFVRDKIATVVEDPDVAARLMPDTLIGCKRLCADTGYYETFNRTNVELVDVAGTPIDEVTPTGVRVGDRRIDLDVLVFATGFDAMTGALERIDVRGRDGLALRDAWAEGPGTYLGLGVAGFPNLFLVNGPGSPSVLSNMVVSIEHHVEWIGDCLEYLRDRGHATVEAEPDAQEAWVRYVNDVASFTVFPSCNSWYLGANVPGKPRVFLPLLGFPPYVAQCAEVVADGYRGFTLA